LPTDTARLKVSEGEVTSIGLTGHHLWISLAPVLPVLKPRSLVMPNRVDVGNRLARPDAVRSAVVRNARLRTDACASKCYQPIAGANQIGNLIKVGGENRAAEIRVSFGHRQGIYFRS
jgi:hypothetical protein